MFRVVKRVSRRFLAYFRAFGVAGLVAKVRVFDGLIFFELSGVCAEKFLEIVSMEKGRFRLVRNLPSKEVT
ncbi:MAG: hypothetical protein Q4G38_00730 [Aeriscardovia aeriphila]|nr:hypothetical protein [Aeriscardovia aeriphila]